MYVLDGWKTMIFVEYEAKLLGTAKYKIERVLEIPGIRSVQIKNSMSRSLDRVNYMQALRKIIGNNFQKQQLAA